MALRGPLLIICLLLAPQASAGVGAASYGAWRNAAIAALSGRHDANSLATAAALRRMNDLLKSTSTESEWDGAAPTALELIARASELAPQNAGINWLHLQICTDTPGCDTRNVATVMRWVDPDNSAAWVTTLATAQKDGDTTEVDRVLTDMARGRRFDLYWNALAVLIYDSLKGIRSQMPKGYDPSDAARLSTATAVVSAETVPPLAGLNEACRTTAAGSERRADCLKLSKLMQRGDTIAVQLSGFGLERRLLPPDSKEARLIAGQRRLLESRSAAASRRDVGVLPWLLNSRARERLAEMRKRPREEDVCLALLRENRK
jgi:hypothetical protein